MKNLTEKELKGIKGGGLSKYAIAGLLALGVFIAGVVDGFLRPFGCR